MKAAQLSFVCMTIALMARAEPSVRLARNDVMKEAFPYQSVAVTEPISSYTDGPLVVLEKLTVVGSMARRSLQNDINDRWARDTADRFSWKQGGRLTSSVKRGTQIDTGAWVSLEESLIGAMPTREIVLKVQLLRLKW
jgi:hypothetical protein